MTTKKTTTQEKGARLINFEQPRYGNLQNEIDKRNKANRKAGRPKLTLDALAREWADSWLKKEKG